jgi:uncharacterized membrane protein
LAGAVLALLSLLLILTETMLPLAPVSGQWVFWALAAVTLIAAVAAVVTHMPVYTALWFALSLLGTAGLLLFDGAQFLSISTVAVYAGAILVMFLFVIMWLSLRGMRRTTDHRACTRGCRADCGFARGRVGRSRGTRAAGYSASGRITRDSAVSCLASIVEHRSRGRCCRPGRCHCDMIQTAQSAAAGREPAMSEVNEAALLHNYLLRRTLFAISRRIPRAT